MSDSYCHKCGGRTGAYGHTAADPQGEFYSCQEPERHAAESKRLIEWHVNERKRRVTEQVQKDPLTAVHAEPGVLDCLVFLHNTRGRFPSYNVIDNLPEPLRSEIAAEAARREEAK